MIRCACRYFLLPALLLLLAFLPVAAQSDEGDEGVTRRITERRGDLVSVFSGHIAVPSDVRQRGTVVCIGGSAMVDGSVSQDVVAILCNVEVNNDVDGAIVGVLSDLTVRNATVGRELVNVLGGLELENTTVRREMVNVLGALDRDELSRAVGQFVNIGIGGKWFPSVGSLLFWLRLFHKFVIFVLLLGLALLVPERIQLMGGEAPVRYVNAFFMGLLGYLGLLVALGLLSITVIGIVPALFAFYVLKWMGIAAIFYAVGSRLGRAVGFAPSVLGAVLLTFGFYALAMMVPSALGFVGLFVILVLKLVFWLLVAVPAVGLMILTRFGTRAGGAQAPAAPPSSGPPAVPTPSQPAKSADPAPEPGS